MKRWEELPEGFDGDVWTVMGHFRPDGEMVPGWQKIEWVGDAWNGPRKSGDYGPLLEAPTHWEALADPALAEAGGRAAVARETFIAYPESYAGGAHDFLAALCRHGATLKARPQASEPLRFLVTVDDREAFAAAAGTARAPIVTENAPRIALLPGRDDQRRRRDPVGALAEIAKLVDPEFREIADVPGYVSALRGGKGRR